MIQKWSRRCSAGIKGCGECIASVVALLCANVNRTDENILLLCVGNAVHFYGLSMQGTTGSHSRNRHFLRADRECEPDVQRFRVELEKCSFVIDIIRCFSVIIGVDSGIKIKIQRFNVLIDGREFDEFLIGRKNHALVCIHRRVGHYNSCECAASRIRCHR